MKQGVEFFKRADFLRPMIGIPMGRICNIEGLSRIIEDGRAFFDPRRKVAVHAKDVIRNHSVVFFIHVIRDNEEKIETRKKGIRKCNVLVRVFMDVILKKKDCQRKVAVRWDVYEPVRRLGLLRQPRCTWR